MVGNWTLREVDRKGGGAHTRLKAMPEFDGALEIAASGRVSAPHLRNRGGDFYSSRIKAG